MKIAIDISYLQTKRAGYGHHTYELLRALMQYGGEHTYTLWGWSNSLDKESIEKLKSSNLKIKVATVPGFVKRFYWNSLKFPDIQTFTGDFDIFHSIEPLLPPIKNKKSILTVHDLAYKKFPQFFETNVLKWDKFIKRNVNIADAIIVQSQQTKNDIQEFFSIKEEKIHIIHLPVNTIFNTTLDEDTKSKVREKYNLHLPFALFVGTLEPRKNIPTLVRAFEEFHKCNNSELHLVIVGKCGWLYEDIINSINNSSEKNRIQYLNYIPETELPVIYLLSKFLIYPSLYEGYGVPVLEAMASGVPVITSNTSSLREIAEGAAFLVDPTNIEEIANAIMKLCVNQSFCDELSKKGLERIKFFNHKTAADKVLNIYKQFS
jgi:glycosyltransferase involved in cell wall biosynthesis